MSKFFTSVIFVKSKQPMTEELKKSLSNSPLLKIFSARDADEVQQIVSMCGKSAILFESEADAKMMIDNGTNPMRGYFRKYVLDWDAPAERRFRFTADSRGVVKMRAIDISYAIWKLEAYLFGVTDVYLKKTSSDSAMSKNPFGIAYFTHFKYVVHDWKIMISTHEVESNISGIIGKNWEQLLETVFSDTLVYKQPVEEMLAKPFCQIIYPHFVDAQMTKLSIVHMARDADFEENRSRFKKFLATI